MIGVVYILTNPAFRPTIIKIGRTTRSAGQRAWEIYENATGVPRPFEVFFARITYNCEKSEKQVHQHLAAHRCNQSREFFDVDIQLAKNTIEEVCQQVDREVITTIHTAPVANLPKEVVLFNSGACGTIAGPPVQTTLASEPKLPMQESTAEIPNLGLISHSPNNRFNFMTAWWLFWGVCWVLMIIMVLPRLENSTGAFFVISTWIVVAVGLLVAAFKSTET